MVIWSLISRRLYNCRLFLFVDLRDITIYRDRKNNLFAKNDSSIQPFFLELFEIGYVIFILFLYANNDEW